MKVRLNKEQKVQILNSSAIYDVMQQILMRENKIGRNQEHFWVVGLDNSNRILFIELIGLGATNRVNANPPDVFRMSIYKLAVKMILVHNHPSGDLTVSEDDKVFTDRMLKVGKLINIEVIDHLIISENAYTSFTDTGILLELMNSGLFEIVEKEKREIEELKFKIIKDQAIIKNKLAIAKKLKAEGMDEKTIKKVTGLYLRDIRKI